MFSVLVVPHGMRGRTLFSREKVGSTRGVLCGTAVLWNRARDIMPQDAIERVAQEAKRGRTTKLMVRSN